MAKVNKVPAGFLDLLGAKTQGKTPPNFSEVLAGVVEMGEFYLADSLSGVRADVNHGGEGVIQSFTVPEGELWLVRGFSINTVLPALTSYEDWVVGFGRLPRASSETAFGESSGWVWAPDTMTTPEAGARAFVATTLPQPYLLLPGININFRLNARDADPARISEFAVICSVLTQ